MTSLPSVSVCFPVYNEEATIEEILREAHTLLASSGLDYEVLICDDGSTDRTKSILETIVSHYPEFRLFRHPLNLGIHATFEHLYSEATKDFVFLNSTDKQWKTGILFELLPLAKDWDVIIASRKKKHYDLSRSFISWIFNVVPRIFFGVRTFDAGAVKLMRREIIQSFPVVSRSPFSEAERLIRAAREGYKITEYPVDTSPRQSGKSHGIKPKVLIEAFIDIFRVFWSINKPRS